MNIPEAQVEYTDDNIRHLSDMEHVRTRPGMYIGKLGDGSQSDDGIYVLLKEIIDNSIDEFKMNAGKRIEVDIVDNRRVSVRDYGRGIPQGKLIDAVSVPAIKKHVFLALASNHFDRHTAGRRAHDVRQALEINLARSEQVSHALDIEGRVIDATTGIDDDF